jgi:hypothetical protein
MEPGDHLGEVLMTLYPATGHIDEDHIIDALNGNHRRGWLVIVPVFLETCSDPEGSTGRLHRERLEPGALYRPDEPLGMLLDLFTVTEALGPHQVTIGFALEAHGCLRWPMIGAEVRLLRIHLPRSALKGSNWFAIIPSLSLSITL